MHMRDIDFDELHHIVRFFKYVDFSKHDDGCWTWKGVTQVRGRGQIRWKGTRQYAHRVAMMMCGVTIPEGYHVRHQCDNGLCVNPDHLLLGTAKQNMNDKYILKVPEMVRVLREFGYNVTKKT